MVQYYVPNPKRSISSVLKFLRLQLSLSFYDKDTHTIIRKLGPSSPGRTLISYRKHGFNPEVEKDEFDNHIIRTNIDDNEYYGKNLHSMLFKKIKRKRWKEGDDLPKKFTKLHYNHIVKDPKFTRIFLEFKKLIKKLGIPENGVLIYDSGDYTIPNLLSELGFFVNFSNDNNFFTVNLANHTLLNDFLTYYNYYNRPKVEKEIKPEETFKKVIDYMGPLLPSNSHNFSVGELVKINAGKYSNMKGHVVSITNDDVKVKIDIKSLNLEINLKSGFLDRT